jgi:hypothetical protein
MRTIVRDKRVSNAILRKLCKENEVNVNNVYISEFGYIDTVNTRQKDVDFCKTDYKGSNYAVEYISGCFCPFIVKL